MHDPVPIANCLISLALLSVASMNAGINVENRFK